MLYINGTKATLELHAFEVSKVYTIQLLCENVPFLKSSYHIFNM